MSALSDIVASLTVSAQNLEARVAAHEAQDAATATQLQTTIDSLNAALAAAQTPDPSIAQAVTDLTTLKANIDAFDVPAVPPAATAATTPPATPTA